MILQRAARSLCCKSSSLTVNTLFKTNVTTNDSLPNVLRRGLLKTSFCLPDPASIQDSHDVSSLPLTKIVATIGPTSEQREPLYKVTKAGMRIMRLNFSHATKEEVELRLENLKHAQNDLQPSDSTLHNQHSRAILLDTKGPEIRTGKLANDTTGHATISLVKGNTITLYSDIDKLQRNGGSTETELYIDYPGLCKCLMPGRKVLLDDGTVTLTVQSIDENNQTVTCVVENSGDLRSRAGVNLPLADTSDLPAMSDKDKADIKYGLTLDVDFIAASFVQSAQGVREIRAHLHECAKELGLKTLPLIIAKIETAGALQNFDEILQESDGIMVARGDLGVEIPLTQVTNAQKEMVAACNAVGKPVIVATQMLESMAKNPRPTRAEVADVSNAVYDGADCVMLSGETAKGKYPDQTVRTMNEILSACEEYSKSGALFARIANATTLFSASPKTADAAIAKAAVAAARERGCKAILVLAAATANTSNESSPLTTSLPALVAANRPHMPIIVCCPVEKMARQLQVYRSIFPIIDPDLQGTQKKDFRKAMNDAKQLGLLQSGDEVVIVVNDGEVDSSSSGNESSSATTMKIAIVP